MLRKIKSTGDIDHVFRAGKRGASEHVVVLVSATPPSRGEDGRVAFVAGKRLGGAVLRNRSKRVLRHALHRTGASWTSKDVVIMAKPSTFRARPADLDASLDAALRRAGVLDE